jgi:hypothetical protein
MYLGVYGALGFTSAVMLGLVALVVAVGGLNASTKLHDKMLAGVLRCGFLISTSHNDSCAPPELQCLSLTQTPKGEL